MGKIGADIADIAVHWFDLGFTLTYLDPSSCSSREPFTDFWDVGVSVLDSCVSFSLSECSECCSLATFS